MKKLLLALGIGLLAASGAMAQNIDTVPGASVSGITAGVPAFQAQNLKFDCSNVTPTSGTCIPLVEQSIGGAVMSATNGLFTNVLQGNAVLSATNGLFVAPTTAANWLVTGTGTAGSAASGVQTVQGIASMTPLLANPGTIATWGLMSGTVPGTVPTNTELVGCKYTSAGFTLTNLQANPLACAVDGSLTVTVNNTLTALVNNADNVTPIATVTGGAGNSPVNSYLFAYNGAGFDRLQVDASKFLKVNCATGCSASTSITSWAGGTLGAMSNFGTTPTAVLVPGMNASLFLGTTAAAAGHGTAAAALRVELPTDGTGVVGLNAGTNTVGKIDILGNAGGTLDTASGTAAATGLSVQGMTASGATFSDAPLGNGLVAISTNPTAVTNGQKVKQMGDLQGRSVTAPYTPPALANNGQGSSITTAAITVQAASGSASFKEYMTSLSCSRNDAGTTAITVAVSDGTTTVTKALPNNGGGGTVTWPFPVPRAWAANTAVTVTPSAGVTTLNCDATGFNAT